MSKLSLIPNPALKLTTMHFTVLQKMLDSDGKVSAILDAFLKIYPNLKPIKESIYHEYLNWLTDSQMHPKSDTRDRTKIRSKSVEKHVQFRDIKDRPSLPFLDQVRTAPPLPKTPPPKTSPAPKTKDLSSAYVSYMATLGYKLEDL